MKYYEIKGKKENKRKSNNYQSSILMDNKHKLKILVKERWNNDLRKDEKIALKFMKLYKNRFLSQSLPNFRVEIVR